MSEILTQPNERRCHRMRQTHILPLAPCCPRSGNPLPGSEIAISYDPAEHILEVASLRPHVEVHKGGTGTRVTAISSNTQFEAFFDQIRKRREL